MQVCETRTYRCRSNVGTELPHPSYRSFGKKSILVYQLDKIASPPNLSVRKHNIQPYNAPILCSQIAYQLEQSSVCYKAIVPIIVGSFRLCLLLQLRCFV